MRPVPLVPLCFVPTVPLVPLWFVPLVPGVPLVPHWFVPTVPTIPPVPPWSVPIELPVQSCFGFGSSFAVAAGAGPVRPPPPLAISSEMAWSNSRIYNKPRSAFPPLRKPKIRRQRTGCKHKISGPAAAEVPPPAMRRASPPLPLRAMAAAQTPPGANGPGPCARASQLPSASGRSL